MSTPGSEELSAPRWYRLACVCPVCSRRPAGYYDERFVVFAKTQPPEKPWMSYPCRKCNTIFLIAWVAIAYAEVGEPSNMDNLPWAA